MKVLVRLCFIGFFAGCSIAVALILIHVLIVNLLPYNDFRGGNLDTILFLFLFSAHHIETDATLGNTDMWVLFGGLIFASSVIYAAAFPVAGFINDRCARTWKKLRLTFLKSKEARIRSVDATSHKKSTSSITTISFFGFTVGLVVATAINAVIGIITAINPHYIMSSPWDDIVIFLCPSQFATIALTEMNSAALIFIFGLILINGIRYFILFFLFGRAWKFVCWTLGRLRLLRKRNLAGKF